MFYPDDSFRNMALGVKISEEVEMWTGSNVGWLVLDGTLPQKFSLRHQDLAGNSFFMTSELVGSFIQRGCKSGDFARLTQRVIK
jgi:hypothetical protein